MITQQDLTDLYEWAKDVDFPVKKAPTIDGYSNKSIDYYWIKHVQKLSTKTLIREKLMTDRVREIYQNDDILFSNYVIFYPGTILKPHKDPDILKYPYKRIQIPLKVPDKDKCYMEWIDKDEKIIWEEGQLQVCDVMNYMHRAFNKSDKLLEFLFVDVKSDTLVEL